MTLDALIEKAARALMAHFHPGVDWDKQPELRRQWYRPAARAAILAVLPDIGEHLAGVVLGGFPEEPTWSSHDYGHSRRDAVSALRAEVRRLTGGGHE